MKRLLIGGIFFLLICGCFVLPQEKKQEQVKLLPPPQDRLTYLDVFRGPIEEVLEKTAIAGSLQEEFLYFKQSGRIDDIFVEYGDVVKKDQILIVLEEEDIQYRLKQQKLVMEKAMIRLEKARIEADLGRLSPGDVRINEIDYEIASLEYEKLQDTFRDKTLRAPFDGIISAVKIQAGEPVEAYEELVRVTNVDRLRLMIKATTDDLSDLQPGLPMELDLGSNRWVKGSIVHVPAVKDKLKDGTPDRNVLLELDDRRISLSYGSIYSVKIIMDRNEDALQVSKQGVRQYFDKYTARVKDPESGIITEPELILGIEGETTWEVLNGIKAGDKVIAK